MRKGRMVVKREEGGGDVRVDFGGGEAAMVVCLVLKSGRRHRFQASREQAFAYLGTLSSCKMTFCCEMTSCVVMCRSESPNQTLPRLTCISVTSRDRCRAFVQLTT